MPLPDDWKPDFDWAVKLGIGLEEASRESEKFRNYAQMKGRVMVNWDAAWRQWCLRAIEFRTKNGKDRNIGKPTVAQKAIELAKQLAAERAAERQTNGPSDILDVEYRVI